MTLKIFCWGLIVVSIISRSEYYYYHRQNQRHNRYHLKLIYLCNTEKNLLMFFKSYYYVLLNYNRHSSINVFSIIYLYIVCCADTISKWRTFFKRKYYFLTCIICVKISGGSVHYCCSSFNKHVCITVVTKN